MSMSVGDGECAVVVGPNGSGKTTLLRLVRGEITPDRGTVTMGSAPDGTPVHFPSVLSARGTVQDYLNEVLSGTYTLLARFTQLTQQLADGHGDTGLADEYDGLLASISTAEQHDKRNIRMNRRRSEDTAPGGIRLATAEVMARKFSSDRAEKTVLRRTRNDDQRLDDRAEHEVRKSRTYTLS
ncbi:MAG: ATP-binding cassette domain-containing protein [Actinomycetaceae bacterium]|nr:ATP-binding cassette domain-containing protein [Actinomycetaceae bacterium]